ncbi:MAG: hypothetical protein M3463_12155 [Verrucomicrobiota bacterium]|nr:hypothetical protein [Verrucomicrobiota bacterium]
MNAPRRPLAQLCLFLALTLSAVTNEVDLSFTDESGAGSREVQFYAHTSRVATPTEFPNGTVLAVYDSRGGLVGNIEEGWLISGEGEDHRLGFFRARLPGPGTYSFAITADGGQPYWTDLLTVTETDGVLHLSPDRIPLESFPHATAPLSGGFDVPSAVDLSASAGSSNPLETLVRGTRLDHCRRR